MVATEVDVSDDICLIKAEFLEIPGVSLTVRQAERLWHLNAAMCRQIVERLIDEGFLRRANVAFVRSRCG